MCKEFIEKYNFKSKQLIDIIKNNIAYLKKNQIELAVVKQIYFMQITINAKVGLPWWSTD